MQRYSVQKQDHSLNVSTKFAAFTAVTRVEIFICSCYTTMFGVSATCCVHPTAVESTISVDSALFFRPQEAVINLQVH
jgi:hypothetical protein